MLSVRLNPYLHCFFMVSEREAEWKEFASSLQHEIGNMRDCIESLRSAMISKVGDMETKLAASNAELANVKGKNDLFYFKQTTTLNKADSDTLVNEELSGFSRLGRNLSIVRLVIGSVTILGVVITDL